ncbi:MAG: hypothetical protein V1692_01185 [bacterium]
MKPNFTFKIILWLIRPVLVLIPIIILAWLIAQQLVTTGQLTAVYGMQHNSSFISRLSPQDRASEAKKEKNEITGQTDYYRTLLAEPIYFDLTLPRSFTKALVEIKFRNPGQLDFQLGAAGGPGQDQYQLKPVDNSLVNKLLADNFNWSSLQAGNLLLLQKGGRYSSVADFLNNLPAENRLAVHNYELKRNYLLSDYRVGKGLVIDRSLRGSLTMYTYIKNETLDFTFTIQDVNRHPGSDPITVNVYYQKDQSVDSQAFADDGESEATLVMSDRRDLNIKIPGLKEGYYKIELPVSEDIFIRQIKTRQSFLVFANRLYLADEVGYMPEPRLTTVYTDARKITARTPHLEGRQVLKLGQNSLNVQRVQKDYSAWAEPNTSQGKKKLSAIESPRGDILLTAKGVFSFTKESFFNPDITALDDGLDLEKEGIDFVLAEYPKQAMVDGWQTAEVEFDLTKLWIPQNKLRFILSIPAIDEQLDKANLDISEISVILSREALNWSELWPKLKEHWLKKIDKLME